MTNAKPNDIVGPLRSTLQKTGRLLCLAGMVAVLAGACSSARVVDDGVGANASGTPVLGSEAQALTSCGGLLVDTNRDPLHCGGCNQTCDEDEGCKDGACIPRIVGSGGPLARIGPNGTLVYQTYANQSDSRSENVLPDFSYSGYQGGGVALPDVPVRAALSANVDGDDWARIQSAIYYVSGLAKDGNGFRGAVVLGPGMFRVSQTLEIRDDGVVLRGSGQEGGGQGGTTILYTNVSAVDPDDEDDDDLKPVVWVRGFGSSVPVDENDPAQANIQSGQVWVGSRTILVQQGSGLAVGDRITVQETPNADWIQDIRMDEIPPNDEGEVQSWSASDYVTNHPRTIVRIEPVLSTTERITVDVPFVDTIEYQYGNGWVIRLKSNDSYRENVGVEDLRIETAFDPTVVDDGNLVDEDHAWDAVKLDRVRNSWVRNVTAAHMARSAVKLEHADRVTVQDVAFIDPVSVLTGRRRYPFFASGRSTNVLFQRCYARDARHSFVTGKRASGPVVWLDCVATNTRSEDGPHQRWAMGLLFDNIETNPANDYESKGGLRVYNRYAYGGGHGWSGAQVMFWNPRATQIVSDAPPGAMNWVVGGMDTLADAPNEAPNEEPPDMNPTHEPPGIRQQTGREAWPRSLYLQQIQDRLGPDAVAAVTLPAQRVGDISSALRQWAGNGDLGDYVSEPPGYRPCSMFPEPCEEDTDIACLSGIRGVTAGGDPVCCDISCGSCNVAGCTASGFATKCCPFKIITQEQDCTDPASGGPPCVMRDPECETGIMHSSNACCDARCGKCGGSGCSDRIPEGSAACCSGKILDTAPSCDDSMPPCVIED